MATTPPEPQRETAFATRMRAKHGDQFVDEAIAKAAAFPPFTEDQKVRIRRIFSANRTSRTRGSASA